MHGGEDIGCGAAGSLEDIAAERTMNPSPDPVAVDRESTEESRDTSRENDPPQDPRSRSAIRLSTDWPSSLDDVLFRAFRAQSDGGVRVRSSAIRSQAIEHAGSSP
jgi:hypothetical protein